MAQNQQSEARSSGRRVAPWRARASSGMQLSVSPPPPPSILKQPRRTLVGIAAVSPGARPSPPPPPARANPSVDADREDENEDGVTDVYAERATLVFKRAGLPEEETTRELPWPAVRLAPVPAAALPAVAAHPTATLRGLTAPLKPLSLPPRSSGVPWASMAAALLPAPEYALPLLVRANAARTRPPRLGIPSVRMAAGLAAAAMLALIALELKPGQGKILVNARDSRGGPVDRLEVFVDGERAPCATAPCYVTSDKGLHEVKVIAEGFEVPAAQGVAVASGIATAANFVVSPSSESAVKVSSQDAVKLAADSTEMGSAPQAVHDALEPKSTAMPVVAVATPEPKATPGLPAYPAPAAPAAPAPKASPARAGSGAARGDGYLNINSIPASACFLDGKPLGSTPRLLVSVSAGSHTVKFRDPDHGSTKTVVVSVGAGETRLAVAHL